MLQPGEAASSTRLCQYIFSNYNKTLCPLSYAQINLCSVPGSVVSVLTAGLQVQVVQCPVLQLLAEVLDTHLQTRSYEIRKLILVKLK